MIVKLKNFKMMGRINQTHINGSKNFSDLSDWEVFNENENYIIFSKMISGENNISSEGTRILFVKIENTYYECGIYENGEFHTHVREVSKFSGTGYVQIYISEANGIMIDFISDEIYNLLHSRNINLITSIPPREIYFLPGRNIYFPDTNCELVSGNNSFEHSRKYFECSDEFRVICVPCTNVRYSHGLLKFESAPDFLFIDDNGQKILYINVGYDYYSFNDFREWYFKHSTKIKLKLL